MVRALGLNAGPRSFNPQSQAFMTALWWTIIVVLMLIGLVGTVIPLLPGSTIILCAAVLHHFFIGGNQAIGWGSLSVLIVLTVLSYVLEMVSGTLGAKYFGA